MKRIARYLDKRKRVKQTKKLAKRMLVINEQQRIEASQDHHPVQREPGKGTTK